MFEIVIIFYFSNCSDTKIRKKNNPPKPIGWNKKVKYEKT